MRRRSQRFKSGGGLAPLKYAIRWRHAVTSERAMQGLAMRITSGFVVYVDLKAIGVATTLDDAKQIAAEYDSPEMRIESRSSSPARMRIWRFQPTSKKWVEVRQ